MKEQIEVYRKDGEIVFSGFWDNEALPFIPSDWVKTIEQGELVDGNYIADSDYKKLRSYPSTGEQLDYIFHNGLDKWKTEMIQPIKDKHPKT